MMSNIATSAPIDKVVHTSETIGEVANIPSTASTSTRIEPEVIIVWIEPMYLAFKDSIMSIVFRFLYEITENDT